MITLFEYYGLLYFAAGLLFFSSAAIAYTVGFARTRGKYWNCFAVYALLVMAMQWFNIPVMVSHTNAQHEYGMSYLMVLSSLMLLVFAVTAKRSLTLHPADMLPTALGIGASFILALFGNNDFPFIILAVLAPSIILNSCILLFSALRVVDNINPVSLVVMLASVVTFNCSLICANTLNQTHLSLYIHPTLQILSGCALLYALLTIHREYLPQLLKTRTRRSLIFGYSAILLIIVAGGLYEAHTESERALREYKHELILSSRMAASTIDDIDFIRIDNKNLNTTNPEYQHCLYHLRNILDRHKAASYAYIMIFRHNKFYFFADLGNGKDTDVSMPGEPYYEAEAQFYDVMHKGIVTTSGPIEDRWGMWISGLAPVVNRKTGQVTAVIGIDYDYKSTINFIRMQRMPILIMTMLLFVVITSFVIVYCTNDISTNVIEDSEQKFSSMFNGSPNCICFFDNNGYLCSINSAGLNTMGWQMQNVLGVHFSSLWPDLYKYDADRAVELVMRGEMCSFDAKANNTENGTTVCWHIVLSPVSVRGNSEGFAAIWTNMTEIHRAKEKALDSALFLSTLINNIPTPIYYKDSEGRYMGCNTAFQNLVNKTADQIVGKTINDILPPALAERYSVTDQALTQNGDTQVFESEFKDLNNKTRNVMFYKAIFKNSEGTPPTIVGTIIDVTERHCMEAALSAEKEWLKTTLKSIGDAVIASDTRGHLTFMNDVAEYLTGWTEAEAIGMPISSVFRIIDDQTKEPLKNPVEQVLTEGICIELTNHTSIIRKDGSMFMIANSCTPIMDTNDQLLGAVLIFHDVTGQYESQRKTEEAELLYHTVFDKCTDSICLVDIDTMLPAKFNDMSCSLLGYSKENFGSIPFSRHYTQDTNGEITQLLSSLPVGQSISIDTQMETSDKQILHVHNTFTMIEIGGRKICSSIIHDITTLKNAEETLAESEKRFRSLVQNSSDVILIVDADSVIQYASISAERLLGYKIDELLQTSIYNYLDNDFITPIKDKFELSINEPNSEIHWEARVVRKDGKTIWLEGVGRNTLSDPHIGGLVVNFSDITERKNREAFVRMQNAAVNAASDQIVITDYDGCITFVNRSFETETGYSSAEVLGRKPNILSSGRHDSLFYANMWRTIKSGGIWTSEIVNKRKDGTEYVEDMSITPVKNEQGLIDCFIAIKRNVTDRKSYEEQLDHLAHHDNLTGLPNRLQFNEKLNYNLNAAQTANDRLAVLFIDLDRFKNINDTLGHNMGDALLSESAVRFRRSLRDTDILARMGGDEFTLIINPIKDISDAYKIAERINTALSKPFNLEGHEVIISASIGISIYPDHGIDSRTLVMNADTAMYRAKELGRNQCVVYSDEMNTKAMERLKLEYGLRGALDKEEFLLYYQPKLDMHSGKVCGAEALLRWQHPEIGLVSPMDFIPLAEETGLIVQIGKWVIKEAVRQSLEWAQSGLPQLCVSLNVSPKQFQQTDILLATFEDVYRQHNLPMSLLEVEITESALMDDPDNAITLLNRLKKMGLRLSIDDFGTGYSSLSYLRQFPIDALKIDRSFIKNIHTNPDDASICCAVIAMAHNLGISVVAEGVETLEQYEYLKSINCDVIQGYCIGRPSPANEFIQIIHAISSDGIKLKAA